MNQQSDGGGPHLPGGMGDQTTTLGGPRPSTAPRTEAVLRRGESLGRYVVLSCIGTGGMGVVYAAYDPELDRKVAVKLMRASLSETPNAGSTRRLIREAQALAKLSHPNVVAVHDTGTFRGQVIMAMEFVAGASLRTWSHPQRPWREVLAVYRQAGLGLAAAHDAGLVHRDFKPSNAILGDDGRVRVLDFGLARALGNAPATAASADAEQPRVATSVGEGSSALDDPLTVPGQVLGTPAFMAPEQIDGHEADARSDQFSYCAALYEALFGRPPFDGHSVAERRHAIAVGRLQEPATGRRVPAAVRRVVVRGLHADPGERYPSMRSLLAALDRARSGRRRQGWTAAALAVVAFGAWGWWSATRDPVPQCTGFRERLEGVWDATRRSAMKAAFTATGREHELEYADRAFDGAAYALDAYGAAWTAAKVEACEATHVRGEQSSELLDLRMACLDAKLRDAGALVDLLAVPDASLVARAVRSVGELQPLTLCDDAARLRARVPPPANATTRMAVTAARDDLGRVRAQRAVGQYDQGLRAAEAVVARAEVLDYRPLVAEARAATGDLMQLVGNHAEAEQALFDALAEAEAVGDDVVRVEAQLALAWTVGYRQSRYDEGRRWLRLAVGTLERLGADARLDHRFQHAAAMVELTAGDYAAAETHVQAAIDAGRVALGERSEAVSRYLSTLGHIRLLQGRAAAALPPLEEMMDIRLAVLGRGHPLVAAAEHFLGATYYRVGRFEAARRWLTEALSHVASGYGAESGEVAIVLDDLGLLDVKQGRFAEALAHSERALAIRRALFADDQVTIARSLNRRGLALERLGRLAEAETDLMAALRMREAILGADHSTAPHVLINVAELKVRQRRFALARDDLDRTERLVVQHLAEDHPYLGYIALGRGTIAAATGAPARAVEHFEEALGRLGASDPWQRAKAHDALGRVLWSTDPARARGHLMAARDAFADLGPGGEVATQDLDAWWSSVGGGSVAGGTMGAS